MFWRVFVVLNFFETTEKHLSEFFLLIREDSQSKLCGPSFCFCLWWAQLCAGLHCTLCWCVDAVLLPSGYQSSLQQLHPGQLLQKSMQGGVRRRSSSSASFYLGLLQSTKLDVLYHEPYLPAVFTLWGVREAHTEALKVPGTLLMLWLPLTLLIQCNPLA